MSIIINTNISSMLGVTALNKNTNAMNKALERLSTGYRINSSKDDAAGCAISTSLTKDVSSLKVAQSNTQMGQSMIDTANGALNNMSTMLQRIRDLAEQSANGTYGADERKAMQTEVDNLLSELQRTKTSTEFNGKQIFGKAITSEEDAIAQGYTIVKTAEELKTKLVAGDANCKVMLFADIDLNDLDDGTDSNWTAVGTGWDTSTAFCGTFDGNGFTISNLKINKGDTDWQGLIGSARGATIKNVNMENVNVTGMKYAGGLAGRIYNGIITNCSSSGTVTGTTYTGGLVGANATNITIINCSSSATVTGSSCTGGLVGLNQIDSTIINCSSSGNVTATLQVGGLVGVNVTGSTITNSKTTSKVTGTASVGAFLGSFNSGELSGNEYNSSINEGMRAVGNAAITPEEQVKDNPDLKIEADPSIGSQIPKVAFGVGVDTTYNLQVGINNDSDSVISVDTGLAFGELNIDVTTEAGARSALATIDNLLTKVTGKQTELGAMSSRLDSAMEYQQIQTTTKTSTNSIIKDADFAKESSNYIKQQILQQTTSSLLSTANQNPSIALMLLGR